MTYPNSGPQYLYRVAQGKSDGLGFVTLTFDPVPQGLTWTASVFPAVKVSQGVDPGIYTPQLRLAFATWTITVDGVVFITFSGLQGVVNFQATGRQQISISGRSVTPNTSVVATLIGSSDDAANVYPLEPYVTGTPYGLVSTGFANQGNTWTLEGLVTAANGTTNLFTSTPGFTSVITNNVNYIYLQSYTLGASCAQLSTVSGTNGVRTWLLTINRIIDEVWPVTVPGSNANMIAAHDYGDQPILIGSPPGADLTVQAGGGGLSFQASWATATVILL